MVDTGTLTGFGPTRPPSPRSLRSASPRPPGSLSKRLGAGTRLALLVALVGQLGMLAHAALVAHVTCGVDGELVHVRAGVAAPASAGTTARADVETGGDEHDHCLLDEDGEAACPTSFVASSAPVAATAADHLVQRGLRAARAPAPLYRLAPKNSPPASSRLT